MGLFRIEDDINRCVCCGMEFKGKSIGPHYKNSKRCAEFKANLRPSASRPLQEISLQQEKKVREEKEEEMEVYKAGSDIFHED